MLPAAAQLKLLIAGKTKRFKELSVEASFNFYEIAQGTVMRKINRTTDLLASISQYSEGKRRRLHKKSAAKNKTTR